MNDLPKRLQTFSGIMFNPFEPTSDQISIFDIAHSLSMMPRFGGHTQAFYSVAEHAVRCSYIVPAEEGLHALCHDNTECYLMDMPKPIKYMPEMKAYRDLEERIELMVAHTFNIPSQKTQAVAFADSYMVAAEAEILLRPYPKWAQDVIDAASLKNPKLVSSGLNLENLYTPRQAEYHFIKRYSELVSGDVLLREIEKVPAHIVEYYKALKKEMVSRRRKTVLFRTNV